MSLMIPLKMDMNRQKALVIHWPDGRRGQWTIQSLRALCPCAQCRQHRREQEQNKSRLKVLPGNYHQVITVEKAEMVGNYALKLHFSDGHDAGIYTFEYLRSCVDFPESQ